MADSSRSDSVVHCAYCDRGIEASDESAYYKGKIYHPSCLGDLLEEEK